MLETSPINAQNLAAVVEPEKLSGLNRKRLENRFEFEARLKHGAEDQDNPHKIL